jgi:hypothetical protein
VSPYYDEGLAFFRKKLKAMEGEAPRKIPARMGYYHGPTGK